MTASSTSRASRGRDLQAEFAFALPPSNFTTNSEPVYACFDMLEADNSVAFSADQILSNEPEYAWASQSWSKIFRVWPEAVVEVVGQDQVRRAGGLGGLGDNGTFDMASPADMESGSLTLSRLVACCLRTDTSFTVRSGGHCNAGCSAMNGYVILGVKGLNIVDPRELVVPSRRSESPGTVWVGSGATAGQAAYFTFTESFRTDPDYPARPAPDVPPGFIAGGLPVGQKPTVGVGGLTLGGGFGFHTRFAGLLCDRIISLTAVRPDTAEEIVATKDNEHSELVWAACGGGGGNYAAITSFTFQMMPVCVVPNCTVIQLEHKMPPTVEALMYFQEWSVRMDTRITANWECASTNLVTIAGIWMGSLDEFEAALVASGLNETTPFTLSDMLASAKEVAYTQAIIDLNGWASVMASGSLFDDYINDRSYFQYVSFFILEPLPDEAMQLLIDEGVQFEANGDFLVYEFQTLGGPPDGSGVPDAGGYVWPNNFSSVDPTSTAFPHRNARHCLMFKAQSATEVAFGPLAVRMRDVYNRVSSYVRGKSPYYNHMDTVRAHAASPAPHARARHLLCP